MSIRYRQSSPLRLLLLFCVSLCLLPAQAANDRAFFWRVAPDDVAGSRATVYLMGSIHFADKSFYPLRQEIERAYDSSDALVVELDIDEADHLAYNQMLADRGVFKGGRTIKDVISDETWRVLRKRLQQLNVSYDVVKSYKPGVLVLMLSSLQVMGMGFDPELGIDAHFLAKAKHRVESEQDENHQHGVKQKKPLKRVIELETLEQQVNLFLDMPDGDLLLKESLHTFEESESLMADMVRYWKAGDEEQISRLLFEDALLDYPAFSSIYEQLFFRRNLRMTAKIEEMLRSQEVYFVVVGSGHLVGDKGIVKSLREKGYQVTRL